MNKKLGFGSSLLIEDIDLSGWLGYTISKGKISYYILQRDGDGSYIRKQITKELYEILQKEKNAKA